jgi:hypothetical protein
VQGRFVFNSNQNKIDLPTSDIEAGAIAIITGWGQISIYDDRTSNELRKANMIILSNNECSAMHPFLIADEQICAFQDIDIGICTVRIQN